MISIRKFINNLISFETLRKVKINLLTFFNLLGINTLFRFINRKKMIILLFHGISYKNFSYNHRRFFPKSVFEKILHYLKEKSYVFITLSDWLKIVNSKNRIKRKYVIITFDDGLKNVVENAYPIMKNYNAKGCFYVVSDIIGNNKLVWTDYIEVLIRNHNQSSYVFKFDDKIIKYPLESEIDIRKAYSDIKNKLRKLPNKKRFALLQKFIFANNIKHFQNIPIDYLVVDTDDIKYLDKKILEVGGHTKTHPLLEYLDNDEYYEELNESKKELESIVGYDIVHICYPGGSYNENIMQLTKKHGYKTGVTVEYGFNTLKTDLFQLKRIGVENNFTLFKYTISGLKFFLKKRFNIQLS